MVFWNCEEKLEFSVFMSIVVETLHARHEPVLRIMVEDKVQPTNMFLALKFLRHYEMKTSLLITKMSN